MKNGAQFDLEDVKHALTARYSDGVVVLTPPAEK